jgi:hypothetical protein
MKLEIKGTITKTTPIEALGKQGNLFKMTVIISKPAPVNEFGETYGKPQHYPVEIIKNDSNAMPNAQQLLNQKVNATCYLNGYDYATTSNIDGIAYGLRLNLKELTFIK